MKLSFGNIILEMNVFNICKQPGDDNDLQEEESKESNWRPQIEELPL